MNRDLRPQPEPITISVGSIILFSILFAVIFWIIGFATLHYPANAMGWI